MKTPRALPAAGWVFVLGLAGAIVACTDFTNPNDPASGLPDVAVATPSFSRDVQPIFTKRCSIGGCHSLATKQAFLVLAPGVAYDNIVNVKAVLSTKLRVSPRKANESWLIELITRTTDNGGNGGSVDGVPRMPLASRPLTPNQIATIVNWINQGAARN